MSNRLDILAPFIVLYRLKPTDPVSIESFEDEEYATKHYYTIVNQPFHEVALVRHVDGATDASAPSP